MAFTKITPDELTGKGVIGQPAVPGLSVEEMQKSVEQIVREVAIPGVNRLAEELEADSAAGSLGSEIPAGDGTTELPEDTPKNVGGVAAAIMKLLADFIARRDNPHGVTASQVGAYTKKETDQAIGNRIVEIGAGDMAKAVYATNGEPGVVDKSADAQQLGGHPPAFYTSRTYTAVLPAEGWTGDGETGYTQTVACEGMTADVVTLQPMILPTGDRATDIAAREALGYISMVETLAGQVTVTCWEDKPAVDLTIYLVEAR